MQSFSSSTNALLEEAYAAHYPRIRKWLRGKFTDKERAEDLAVETFLTLARMLEAGKRPKDMEAYLMSLAEGRARNEKKRLSRSPEELMDGIPAALARFEDNRGIELEEEVAKTYARDLEPLEWVGTPPPLTPEDVEFRADFDSALRELPECERDAFILTELRGLTVREAADVLGVARSTVDDRVAAARARLKSALS